MSGKSRSTKGKTARRSKASDNIMLPYEAKLNRSFTNDQTSEALSDAFIKKQALELSAGVVLHNEPFQCCQLKHFIEDEQFLEGLRDELLDQIFYEKNNDLYNFQQTDDLRQIPAPHVRQLRRLFDVEFRSWLATVTGFTFTDKIDLTCSKYDYTDVLLCHDDELDTRRVAFALYLVPPWSASDGGTLDLFSMDEHGQPLDVVKCLSPSWNSLSWFEVTESSHHQVSEVLTNCKTRLSVNGWFHSLPVARRPRYVEPCRPLHSHGHIEEEMVYEWLNPIYLDAAVQTEIRAKFEENSEIELQGVLREDKYNELMSQLKLSDLTWQTKGPPNKRKYHSLAQEDMPVIVEQCVQFLCSEAMFLILSNLTGLRLHRLAPKSSSDDEKSHEDIPRELVEKTKSFMTQEEGAASGGLETITENSVMGGVATSSEVGEMSQALPEPEMIKRQRLSEEIIAVGAVTLETKTDNSIMQGVSTADIGETCQDLPNPKMIKRQRLSEEAIVTENGSKSEDEVCDPKCNYEVRRWRHGCYTLVHDTDPTAGQFALDALLYCMNKEWRQDYGGFTSYIAAGEDEELLTVSPAPNSLALVYRDRETLKFVKHINQRTVEKSDDNEFYDFSVVYYE